MINLLRKSSIKVQLLIGGVISILVMLLIIFITYMQTSNIIFDKNREYTIEIMEKIEKDISTELDTINKMMSVITYSELVQKYLLEADPVKKYDLFLQVDRLITNMKDQINNVSDIIIIGTEGKGYNNSGSTSEIKDLDEFTKTMPRLTKPYYSGVKEWEIDNKHVHCILAGAHIYSNNSGEKYGSIIGQLILVIDVKEFRKHLNGISQKVIGDFHILDRNGVVYADNGTSLNTPSLVYTREISNKKAIDNNYIVHEKDLASIGGKIVSIHKKSELFKGLNEVRRLDVYILVTTIVFLFALYFFIGRNVISPIQSFVRFIDSIREGNLKNLKKRVYLAGYKEIGIVAEAFNNLFDSIDGLTHRILTMNTKLYEAELEKKQAELEYLKSQINPHFLHNTLETIKGMAVVKGNFEVRDMTDNLGNIFRYCIKGQEFVFLHEEIDIVKAYIQIQKVRFKKRFDDVYEFEEGLLNYKIIKMIMQPIAENAIIHGIEPNTEKCLLKIGGKIEVDHGILLWVKDNGLGIDDAVLSDILKGLKNHSEDDFLHKRVITHIGLANVNRRIKLIYGDEYGISIESKLNEGTAVYIRVPGEG